MEFFIERSDFIKGLQRVQSVAMPKAAMPILANILILAKDDKLTISATNIEIGLEIEYKAEVKEEGLITVSARKLYDIVKELPDSKIYVKLDDNRLKIEVDKSRFSLATISANEYPAQPDFKSGKRVRIDKDTMLDMIKKTSYAISKDDTRRTLSGAYFEIISGKARMVATDGHRLALSKSESGIESSKDMKVIIPRRAVDEILKMHSDDIESVEFLLEDNHMLFKFNQDKLIAKLIEGAFPNYEQVIPKSSKEVIKLNKRILQQSLRRVATLADERSHMVRIKIGQNKVLLTSEGGNDIGKAADEFEIDYQSADLELGLNSEYLLDLLDSIDKDEILLSISGSLDPVMIKPDGAVNSFGIVMPMRL